MGHSPKSGKSYGKINKLNFMVEVFKTNVQKIGEAKMLLKKLTEYFPNHKINLDLADGDKILRVENDNILSVKIIEFVISKGFQCRVLE